jgi:hypothetical protein
VNKKRGRGNPGLLLSGQPNTSILSTCHIVYFIFEKQCQGFFFVKGIDVENVVHLPTPRFSVFKLETTSCSVPGAELATVLNTIPGMVSPKLSGFGLQIKPIAVYFT